MYLVQMYNDGEFNLSQKQYSYNELYMPVIMPKWIADNRIVSKPVGAVVAPKPVGAVVAPKPVGAVAGAVGQINPGARNALLSQ